MSATFRIRPATTDDAPALLTIYRHYVEHTPVSFELEAPDAAAFEARIDKALAGWAWLVAEADGAILGYAYGSAHRPREAYRFSVEVSAYVDAAHHRKGVARALYEALFPELEAKGHANAYAGITVPNDASIGFHASLGFAPIGVFPRVGYKFDAWHDVAWMHRALSPPGHLARHPAPPD